MLLLHTNIECTLANFLDLEIRMVVDSLFKHIPSLFVVSGKGQVVSIGLVPWFKELGRQFSRKNSNVIKHA